MNTKIHIVEGLPAVGKSTYSLALQSRLKRSKIPTIYYKEETSQPVDLFRQAVLKMDEYTALLSMPLPTTFLAGLEQNSFPLGPYRIVAYTTLDYGPQVQKTILPIMRAHDIGDGRVPFTEYCRLHLYLWERFVKTAQSSQKNYITEGAFLHNQLLDILGFYDPPDSVLVSYYRKLMDIIAPLQPRFYYVYPSDIRLLIDNALSERGYEKGTWGYGFERWLKNSVYGRKNHLRGRKGMVATCERLHETSLFVLDQIDADVDMIKRQM